MPEQALDEVLDVAPALVPVLLQAVRALPMVAMAVHLAGWAGYLVVMAAHWVDQAW